MFKTVIGPAHVTTSVKLSFETSCPANEVANVLQEVMTDNADFREAIAPFAIRELKSAVIKETKTICVFRVKEEQTTAEKS